MNIFAQIAITTIAMLGCIGIIMLIALVLLSCNIPQGYQHGNPEEAFSAAEEETYDDRR